MSHLPRIPLAGVIGSPVSHSLSPALHGYWLRHYRVRGYYIPMDIAADDLEYVLRSLPRMGFVGCNVTIPHKEAALSIADIATDRAAIIGAANTLSFREGKIFADNTDGHGFMSNLVSGAPNWRANAGPAAVIGAGGAARAILLSLLEAGCPEIRLTNRTRARAEALSQEFGGRFKVYDWATIGDMLDGALTVVNTSALGMDGQGEFTLPLDALSPKAVVTDCVYTPLRTPLLEHASAIGCTTVDGLGMLLYQGAPGFERWFGQRPAVTAELRHAVLSAV